MTLFNPKRGDVRIALEGRDYVLRPSFAVIVAIEAHFGRGIFDIARDFAEGRMTRAADMAKLLELGLKGVEQTPPQDVAQAMMETGLVHCVEPLGKFLAHGCGIAS